MFLPFFYIYKLTQIFRYLSNFTLIITIISIIKSFISGDLAILINNLPNFKITLLLCIILLFFGCFIIIIPKLFFNKIKPYLINDLKNYYLLFAIIGNFILTIFVFFFTIYQNYILSTKYQGEIIYQSNWFIIKKRSIEIIDYLMTQLSKKSQEIYLPNFDYITDSCNYISQILQEEKNILENNLSQIITEINYIPIYSKILPWIASNIWEHKLLIISVIMGLSVFWAYNKYTLISDLKEDIMNIKVILTDIISHLDIISNMDIAAVSIFKELAIIQKSYALTELTRIEAYHALAKRLSEIDIEQLSASCYAEYLIVEAFLKLYVIAL